MNIARELTPKGQLKPLFADPLKLPFGRHFTDHMFTMEYAPATGWGQARIKPYGPLVLEPSANVFHYSQEIFEGQKAYKSQKGEILMFRPQENARRLSRSLKRMCMPEIPEAVILEAECELLKVEERWVPAQRGASLYIRPTVIGTEPALGIKPSSDYLFYIILSPVGPYFKEGFNPVSLWVSDTYSRAGSGGTGEAKTGGNYAGSLLATREATQKGYSQVLWLDAGEHRYVEEVGAMNIFFVIEGKLVTPALGGTILHGITRKSVLELADRPRHRRRGAADPDRRGPRRHRLRQGERGLRRRHRRRHQPGGQDRLSRPRLRGQPQPDRPLGAKILRHPDRHPIRRAGRPARLGVRGPLGGPRAQA